MRRIALALAALGCALLTLPASAGAGPLRLYPLHAVPDSTRGGRVVDSQGRQVLLRGVNVNSLVDYASATRFAPAFALDPKDPARMAAIGWNVVRLGVSWSRLEPQPGSYDEAYLESIAGTVKAFRNRGLYTIIDFHQDGWGQAAGAGSDLPCAPGEKRVLGFDGAPAWATLDGALPPCIAKSPELSAPVLAAWRAFFGDAKAPDGYGIQTRYLFLLYKVAERFAHSPSVAGYDVLEEPDTVAATSARDLSDFYARALAEIRLAEKAHKGSAHMVFIQPSVLWKAGIRGAPPGFREDGNVVYAPHVASGGSEAWTTAVAEAKVFGGAPVVAGEWPAGAADALANQDRMRAGGVLSAWRQSCGDPDLLAEWFQGRTPIPSGVFDVDCADNSVKAVRGKLVLALSRAYVRAAPGRLDGQSFDPSTGRFAAWGSADAADGQLVAFFPRVAPRALRSAATGLGAVHLNRAPGGGVIISARPQGGPWSLVAARP